MDKVWKAEWIADESFYGLEPIDIFHKQLDKKVLPQHDPELKNRHMLVRKAFTYENEINIAYLDITADDYYKLYVNGVFIGQGPAPSYHFHYNYNRYDISRYLNAGKNIIAVHVYYQGLINRVWNSGDYRQGMIAELSVNDRVILGTDSTWKYTQALEYKAGIKTIGYDTQFLENIDNRLKVAGWRELDYNDSHWKNAMINSANDHKLVLQETPVLQVYKVLPSSVKIIEEGHYLIDFGEEITGQLEMKAKGAAGQEVIVFCGEELEDEVTGRVRYKMRCNCNYNETWILSGNEDTLEYYDYKAFRYAEIIAPPNVIKEDSFCAVVRHYPFDDGNCKFNSSNPLLNNIWDICKNGVKYGSQEVYVDCPSREKGQYLGDATITSHSHAYLTGDLRFFRKMLKDFSLSAHICPGMMAVAPGSYMQEIADFSLQWPLQLLNYYRQSGDIDFLREMYPTAEGILQYFKRYERHDGLIENVKEKWNLVDWPQNLRDSYDFDLSNIVGDGCHNVINAFYYGAIKTVEEIKDILNDNDFAVGEKKDLGALKQAFTNAFYRNNIRLFADSEISSHTALHSNAIPLFYGLVPDEAVDSVVHFIREKKLSCGVYISYFLLKGLAGVGEYDLVYELITSQEEHSWGNMVKEGATTCFEAWGKDQKWNTSLCHPWASAPIPVLIEDIAGIKPAKPGWEEVNFNPNIPKTLETFTLELMTVRGKIRLEYRHGEAKLSVPEGIRIV